MLSVREGEGEWRRARRRGRERGEGGGERKGGSEGREGVGVRGERKRERKESRTTKRGLHYTKTAKQSRIYITSHER